MAKHEIYIYDVIGKDFWGEGVTAQAVQKELDKAKAGDEIVVRINSPGGDVWEGEAIYNALTRRGNITIEIDSLAASAASFVAMAGDRIRIAENASMMIHEAWTMGFGHKRELAKTINRLEAIDQNISAKYAARSGKRDQTLFLADMEAETWYTAKEAVDAGLADEIGQKLKVKAAIREPMLNNPLSVAAFFKHIPQSLLWDDPDGAEPTPEAKAAMTALDVRLRIAGQAKSTPLRDSLQTRLTKAKQRA